MFLFSRPYFCFFRDYNLYKHSSKKTCEQYLLFPKKTPLIIIIILRISIVLLGGNSRSELSLIFIYFWSESSEFLVINLIKSLNLPHSSYLLFPLIISINFFKVFIYFFEKKVQRIDTMNFYGFRIIVTYPMQ